MLPENHSPEILHKRNEETGSFEFRAVIIGAYHVRLDFAEWIMQPTTIEAMRDVDIGLPFCSRDSHASYAEAVKQGTTDAFLKFEHRLVSYFLAAPSCAGLLVPQTEEFAPLS